MTRWDATVPARRCLYAIIAPGPCRHCGESFPYLGVNHVPIAVAPDDRAVFPTYSIVPMPAGTDAVLYTHGKPSDEWPSLIAS